MKPAVLILPLFFVSVYSYGCNIRAGIGFNLPDGPCFCQDATMNNYFNYFQGLDFSVQIFCRNASTYTIQEQLESALPYDFRQFSYGMFNISAVRFDLALTFKDVDESPKAEWDDLLQLKLNNSAGNSTGVLSKLTFSNSTLSKGLVLKDDVAPALKKFLYGASDLETLPEWVLTAVASESMGSIYPLTKNDRFGVRIDSLQKNLTISARIAH